MREGGEAKNRREKTPRQTCRDASKKGRTTPLYFEGLKFARFAIRQSIYEAVGNFYSSDSGEKGIKRKKAGPLSEKIRRSPAAADLTAVCRLDIYGKTVSCILLKNPENPHKH